jgi:hypothetical protein
VCGLAQSACALACFAYLQSLVSVFGFLSSSLVCRSSGTTKKPVNFAQVDVDASYFAVGGGGGGGGGGVGGGGGEEEEEEEKESILGKKF